MTEEQFERQMAKFAEKTDEIYTKLKKYHQIQCILETRLLDNSTSTYIFNMGNEFLCASSTTSLYKALNDRCELSSDLCSELLKLLCTKERELQEELSQITKEADKLSTSNQC